MGERVLILSKYMMKVFRGIRAGIYTLFSNYVRAPTRMCMCMCMCVCVWGAVGECIQGRVKKIKQMWQ